MSGPARLRVFAAEDTTLQVTWGELPAQEVRLRAGDVELVVQHEGGPAAPVIEGLVPDLAHDVEVVGEGWRRSLSARTLPTPPGEELVRFATVSDIHLGLDVFGFRGTMREHPAPEPEQVHTARCTRAALREAEVWGARHLVVKGDVTETGSRGDWRHFGRLLAETQMSGEVIPGNHDVHKRREVEVDDALTDLGLVPLGGTRAVDLPGVRLVLVDTTSPGVKHGAFEPSVERVLQMVGSADGPVVLVGHHHPMALPMLTFWPPGIPSQRAKHLFRQVAAIRPDVLYLAGHTHRHRKRTVEGVEVVEVGSPKDYPGTWGGYVVHEGGVRQVVRRVTADDCLPWLERSRWAAFGAWGRWSPGRLDQRCFSHTWATDAAGAAPSVGQAAAR